MSGLLNAVGEMWWAWMGPMFWQASLLILLIYAIDRLMRRRVWPQVRYALWLLIMVKLALPPTFSLPTSLVTQVQPYAQHAFMEGRDVDQWPEMEKSVIAASSTSVSSNPAQGSTILADNSATPRLDSQVVLSSDPAKNPERLSWKAYLMAIWFLTALALGVWLIVRFRQLRKIHCRPSAATPLPVWLERILQEAAQKLKMRRLPKVILTKTIASPAVLGVFRPVLLIPRESLQEISRENWEHILLHELAHLKRRDLWMNDLFTLMQVVYWFNPLLWLVQKQLRHLRELCCDATVARILREKTVDYRQTIVDMAHRLLTKPSEPVIGILGLYEDSCHLVNRLDWLEKKTWRHPYLRKTICLSLIAFMLACILPMVRAQMANEAADLIFTGENPGDRFWTTTSGDVNGDGFDDLIVGAPRWNDEQGRVYVFFGGSNMDNKADLIMDGEPETKGRFGGLLGCGDVDNDGFDDIVVSAWRWKNLTGRVYLFYGDTTNKIDSTADLIFEGEEENRGFGAGWSGILVEDIDGDGHDDVIIPNPGIPEDKEFPGRVFLYWGNVKSKMDTDCDLAFIPEWAGLRYGVSIACGDIDHDNYKDIVIGANAYPFSDVFSGVGRAYLYYGNSKDRMDSLCDLVFDADSAEVNGFGSNIGIGDVDADGYDDIAISSLLYGKNQGRVYLYYGDSKSNIDAIPDMMLTGETENNYFGQLVYCRGDVNSDGFNDILVGAYQFNNLQGRAYVFLGDKKEKMDDTADRIFTGENDKDWFGNYGGTYGDFNNDGYDDFAIGARNWEKNAGQGRVYLYHGGSHWNMLTSDTSSEVSKSIFQAVSEGYTEQVKLLISNNVDVNEKDKNGKIPLHYAAENGHEDLVKLLIEKGSQVDIKDQKGYTPLNYALKGDYKTIVDLLIAKGANAADLSVYLAAYMGDSDRIKKYIESRADLNTEDEKGDTLLCYAAKSGNMQIVKLLVEAGADVNTGSKWPPLYVAVDNNNTELAEYLIDKGAQVDPDNDWEWTPLQEAPYAAGVEMVKLLLENGADINAGPWTALYAAVDKDRKDIVEFLIQNGADVNANEWGNPVLCYACSLNDPGILKLLINNNADIHIKDTGGRTCLHWAMRNENIEIAEILITEGAEIDIKDLEGVTPLQYAISRGKKDHVRFLVEKGANDPNGLTLLHYAAVYGDAEACQKLINKGVYVNIKDNSNRSPLHLSAEKGYKNIVELLCEYKANINTSDKDDWTPLLSSVWYKQWDVALFLIEKGAHVNVKDSIGHTPLHYAAEQGQEAVVELLLEKGADVSDVDNDGDTPLHHAAYQGHTDIAQLLLSKGANINAQNKWGWTALHRVAARGHLDMAKFLILYDAQFNLKNDDGLTTLDLAKEKKHSDIVELLKKHGEVD